MRRYLSYYLAGALALAAGGDSLAEPRMTTVRVKVSAAGLDLGTEAGADVLLHRLSRAATQACGGSAPSPVLLEARQRFRVCRANAMAGAVADAVEQSRSDVIQRRFAQTRDAKLVRLASR